MPMSVCRVAARTSTLVLPAFPSSCSSLRSAVTKSPLLSLAGVWLACGRVLASFFIAVSFGVYISGTIALGVMLDGGWLVDLSVSQSGRGGSAISILNGYSMVFLGAAASALKPDQKNRRRALASAARFCGGELRSPK